MYANSLLCGRHYDRGEGQTEMFRVSERSHCLFDNMRMKILSGAHNESHNHPNQAFPCFGIITQATVIFTFKESRSQD